ncbi:MAG: M3 family oligoendopeptidase [Chloroflexi bacterium]|nr:M3 family oligoendopeptidase [Chloroflexota bacterium]
MFAELTQDVNDFSAWTWPQIEPYFQDLEGRALTAATVVAWLNDRARLLDLIQESYDRLYVATTLDTNDEEAERRYLAYSEQIIPPMHVADHKLQEKLLASGLQPEGFAVALRNIRAEATLFRAANLPLFVQEDKLGTEYDKLIGAQTVEWDGAERTLTQLRPVYQEADRARREQAWRLASERQLADRAALSDLWGRFLRLRLQIAANADMPDYRAYAWQVRNRFDYTPEDNLRFHDAIAEVVVPAAARLYEKRRQQLGVETLRPWDRDVDPAGRDPLRPFNDVAMLKATTAAIFRRLDGQLGEYFGTMWQEKLLDLDNRKGKAPGGYCIGWAVTERPFIFMNAVGIHDDVQTMLHEAGHAFHAFESYKLPLYQRTEPPMEFCEVASMAMELLAAPYLKVESGGFYDHADADRALVEHLEGIIQFWPYMAVVDGFQHWVYQNPDAALDPAHCDATWGALWDRFMVGIDYSGLEDVKVTGWQRKLHIYHIPFYYIEYGLAQLGAVQVWRNSLSDEAQAVADYRRALLLGGTATLPDLFAAAGAKFAMDADILREAVELVEAKINELEPA